MVTEPNATPVTAPDELTVAGAVLEEVQVTALMVAFAGSTVAASALV